MKECHVDGNLQEKQQRNTIYNRERELKNQQEKVNKAIRKAAHLFAFVYAESHSNIYCMR